MAARRKRRFTPDDIPTTSTSDIAFLLIIFFILTTAMIQTKGFRTDLPAGQKSDQPPEKTTTIQLHEGTIRLNDKVVSLAALREELRGMRLPQKDEAGRIVLFEATGTVQYQEYFEIMAAVTKAGGHLVIVREGEEGT